MLAITGGFRGTSLSSVELPRIIPTKYRRLRIDPANPSSAPLSPNIFLRHSVASDTHVYYTNHGGSGLGCKRSN